MLPFLISARWSISVGMPLESPTAYEDLVALPFVCREEMALLWKHGQVSVTMHDIHVGPPQLVVFSPHFRSLRAAEDCQGWMAIIGEGRCGRATKRATITSE